MAKAMTGASSEKHFGWCIRLLERHKILVDYRETGKTENSKAESVEATG